MLGSTGSVGTQTLDIVRAFPNDFNVIGLACNRNLKLLQSQIEEFEPDYIHCNGTESEMASLKSNGCQDCDLDTMVGDPNVDMWSQRLSVMSR